MTLLEAIILGVIQGLTEFFPVSSSGHLKLAEALFGYTHLSELILFDLACHIGTLGSIFFVFFSDIKEMLFKSRDRLMQVILATLPLFPLLLVMKPIKQMYDRPEFLGYFFLITATLLWIGTRFELKTSGNKWKDALIIGGFQAIAILPGISRSGSTISGARLIGWSPSEALTFSFLLAIPAILGGVVVEVSKSVILALPAMHYIVGALTSFGVGTGCLYLLKSLVRKHSFLYFAWYCLVLGIISLYLFN